MSDVEPRPADGTAVDEGVVGPLAQQFGELTRALLRAGSVSEVLERIVGTATDLVPNVHVASITLRGPDGRYNTPTETDPAATELDLLQYEYDEGPCVVAAHPDGPAVAISNDLGADPRWPRFGPAAAKHGFRSLIATALLTDATEARVSGALNVYSREVAAFTAEHRDALLLLATHASLALATTHAVTRQELEMAQLRLAIDSRDVIGQAKGVLMARRGISAQEAFDILRRTSQNVNVKLRDLALAVAERAVDIDELPGADVG